MADFAEQTPFAGQFANGAAGAGEHDRFPDRCRRSRRARFKAPAGRRRLPPRGVHAEPALGAPVLDGRPDRRTGASATGCARRSPGMLSGGMSGFALNHSDTGGYTTLVDPPVQRSAELLERWSEMNAFGGAMFRTHEGNRRSSTCSRTRPRRSRPSRAGRGCSARWPLPPGWSAMRSAPGCRSCDRCGERPAPRRRHARLHARTATCSWRRRSRPAPRARPSAAPGRWKHVWSARAYEGGRIVTVESPLGEPAVFVRGRVTGWETSSGEPRASRAGTRRTSRRAGGTPSRTPAWRPPRRASRRCSARRAPRSTA